MRGSHSLLLLRKPFAWIVLCFLAAGTRRVAGVDCLPPPDGLVAWYRLEGNAQDATGKYPGQIVRTVSYGLGEVGNAATIAKASGIRVGNAPGLQPQQLTVAAWIKSPPPGSYRYIVSKSLHPTQSASYGLYSSGDGRLRFYICHSLTPLFPTFSPPAATTIWNNQWHFVAGTYDGQAVRLFVDGKEIGSGAPTDKPILYGTSAWNGDLFIGNGEAPTERPRIPLEWPGSLDEVQIYRRALASSEIAEIYASQNSGLCGKTGIPVFTVLPTDQQFKLGAKLTLVAGATGIEPLSFQWRKNGQSIPGATQSTFTIGSAEIEDGGAYDIAVFNPIATITSDPIQVLPDLNKLPGVDRFIESTVFVGLSGAGISSNKKATLETGEPLHAQKKGGKSVWFRYLAPDSGLLTLSTRGSDFDTLLAAYSGDTVDRLTALAGNDDESGLVTSTIRLPVRKGRTYRIAVDGRRGSEGTIIFRWLLEPSAVDLLEISRQPVSRTTEIGGLAVFSPSVLGANVFQWFHNGQPLRDDGRITGANEVQLVIKKVIQADLGSYELLAGGVDGIRTERVTLQLNDQLQGGEVATFGSSDKLADVLDDLGTLIGKAGLNREGRPRLAGLASGTSGTQIFSTFGSGAEPGEPVHCGVGTGRSQWFAYLAETSGLFSFDTFGSDFDTVLAIYRDTGTGVGLFDGLVSVGCNDNATLQTTQSRVVISAEAGTTYLVAIDTPGPTPGTAVLNYQTFRGARLLPLLNSQFIQRKVLVEGVVGLNFELQSSGDLRQWSPVVSTNASSDQFELNLPTSGRVVDLFRVQAK